ncbi:hypothetical protein CBG46_05795 [Actinobacillus succinogenes]|uniref:PEGA domain-containing protein n=1 Tax=Actinobacillus succinogenes (strain ATCC 55618 / DSM 22257 / CCUG 43843 / 130Z) TaxID=339671 RepID=A6VQZ8_ACTSZ|nr:hypothetical protein [Actinobacillus succinogenes]ABR75395.1 conserved hypothetical protein; putative conserved domain [Actinobacillus succinogenes 130Z]PHI40217.1 hypothetical protein CBG46_05795 [Actinobacillus succinogenes]
MMKKLLISALLGVGVLLTGCATIVGDKTQTISINSNPAGANYSIQDETGKVVQTGVTPANVILEKHDGSYFGKKTYKVTFSKEGYKDSEYSLSTMANGKYILGNLVFGGLVGWFVVDPLNGGMYTISPETVDQELENN